MHTIQFHSVRKENEENFYRCLENTPKICKGAHVYKSLHLCYSIYLYLHLYIITVKTFDTLHKETTDKLRSGMVVTWKREAQFLTLCVQSFHHMHFLFH